jgi:hypothetical protein
MGMPVNLELLLGTVTGASPSTVTWIVGLIMHLIISGLIAPVYAVGFEYVVHRAGWLVGLALGIIHSLIGGAFLGLMPKMHPMVPEIMPAPGAFMSNLGMIGIVAFVVLHLIYGAIVGAAYGPVHRPITGQVEA